MALGLCASSHLDGTLAKLDEFGKSDAFKKASGIFSLLKVGSAGISGERKPKCFKQINRRLTDVVVIVLVTANFLFYGCLVKQDKNDVDVEKMKSTLILCYGYVALNAPEDQLLIRLDNDILHNISKLFNTKVELTGMTHYAAILLFIYFLLL